jgi:hypothetical protein
VVDHPDSGMLDPGEYASRSIGSIMFAYIAGADGVENPDGDSVWGLARLYSDADLTGLSTSPGVVFRAADGNQNVDLDNGQTLLIEGSPSVLSHLAICALGVWDKSGPPGGIRSDSTKENDMATEETETEKKEREEREDKARKDSEGGNIDKLLAAFDAVTKMCDGLGKRMDAMETADKARKDAAEDPGREKGDPKRVVHDAAAELKERGERSDIQARFDSLASAWGERAEPPMQSERPIDYRVRLAGHHQKYCTEPSFKDLDLAAIAATNPAVLDGLERRIIADSRAASANPTTFGDQILYRTRTHPDTGHRITEAFGRTTFIAALKPNSMRVTKFNTPEHGTR